MKYVNKKTKNKKNNPPILNLYTCTPDFKVFFLTGILQKQHWIHIVPSPTAAQTLFSVQSSIRLRCN